MDVTRSGSQLIVALYQASETGKKLIDYRSPAPGADSFFLVSQDDYRLYAFEDLNNDYIYQPGEPAASDKDPALIAGAARRQEELDYLNLPGIDLQLSSGYQLPLAVDLSAHTLEQQLGNAEKRYLKITSWDNPAFSQENVEKGLWQPLVFLEEIGFGLYLLEELDPNKQPLLLVHGINGSPTNFRELAQQLDDRYQILLFHYPSGVQLEHTAFVLHRAVSDFLKRFPDYTLKVLAHSMGGLVSRGMLITNSQETNARIDTYITLATPWSGHDSARMGVEWSPAIAPVWKSMVPNSRYLGAIFSKSLADNINHHLFFSYAHDRYGPSKGDDGVVTVKSQLNEQAQHEAHAIYGINDNHNGILTNPCSVASVQQLLVDARGAEEPLPSCIPTSP
jgi:pimeloyl-ACP methyl ester carboxylesterase